MDGTWWPMRIADTSPLAIASLDPIETEMLVYTIFNSLRIEQANLLFDSTRIRIWILDSIRLDLATNRIRFDVRKFDRSSTILDGRRRTTPKAKSSKGQIPQTFSLLVEGWLFLTQSLTPNWKHDIYLADMPPNISSTARQGADMVDHIVNVAIPIFNATFPNSQAIFFFDNASYHSSYATDALRVESMNLNPGGKQEWLRGGYVHGHSP